MGRNEERSLDLDIETVGSGADAYPIGRIAVVGTHACTRDGSADTITADCRSVPALEREIGRLRDELDDALEQAAGAFGDSASPARRGRPREELERSADSKPGESASVGLDLTVRQVMTREVVTVPRNAPLTKAKAKMDAGSFRHLVVLDENGDVAGVLSQLDLVFNSLAWSLGESRRAYENALDRITVKEVMQSEPVSVDPSAPLAVAARQMIDRKIGCLPVVEAEVLVGIVTESDFLALFVND